MENKQFILVETSQYVPLNPDRSSKSVPLNAHFDITIRLFEESQKEEDIRMSGAKPAPTVMLADLASGEYPLFGSSSEVSQFANSLIISDSNWSKNYILGSDTIKFTYTGAVGTLKEDFVLWAYSDQFNSMAEYKGKSVIHVKSQNFVAQFPAAFNDDYEISLPQVYAPVISAFAPEGLSPVEAGRPEYEVAFGTEVLLAWTISGSSLKSPTLTENDGPAETVSLDTPVKKRINQPTVFCLTVESNAYAGVKNSRKLSFGITTAPSITKFQAVDEYILSKSQATLEMEAVSALSCTITAKNSTESSMEVPATSKSATVNPVLKDEKERLVEYTLTASGSKGKSPAFATATASIFVSRWKKKEQKPASVLRHGDEDSVVRPFEFLNNNYCFSAQAVWKSEDGSEWKELSKLVFPEGAIFCKTACGCYDGVLYVAAGTKDGAVYLTQYDLIKNQWSDSRFFGPDSSRAGGAFAMADWDKLYYFAPVGEKIACYNYSPEPFDCWGQIGWLETPARVLDVDSLLYKNYLYIGVCCENKQIYVYRVSIDLKQVDEPLKIAVDTSWIRLVEINDGGGIFVSSGLFDIETGIKRDMIFEVQPVLLGVVGKKNTGAAQDGNIWFMEF